MQLEQVVDRALQSPLGAGAWCAADQYPAAVLDGADLAEHRLDDRLAPGIDRPAFLGSGLRAIRCLGVASLGIGPRAAGGGSECLKRPVAMYGSPRCCSQVSTFSSEKEPPSAVSTAPAGQLRAARLEVLVKPLECRLALTLIASLIGQLRDEDHQSHRVNDRLA